MILHVPIFDVEVGFVKGGTWEDVVAVAKDIDDSFTVEKPGPNHNGTCWFFDDGSSLIWIRRGRGYLVHEALHAANHICRTCEIDDEETLAYLLQYIFYPLLDQ